MDFENYKSDLLTKIDRGLKYAHSLNVDAAEIFLIKQHELKLSGISGLIQAMNGGNIGVGCRCLIGKKIGFASSSGISEDAVNFAVKTALKHAKINNEDNRWQSLVSTKEMGSDGEIDYELVNLDPEEAVKTYTHLFKEALDYDKRITAVMGEISYFHGTYAIGNTEGIAKATSFTGAGGGVYVSAIDNGKTLTGSKSIVSRKIPDFTGIGRQGAEKAIKMVGAKPLGQTGQMKVILNNGAAAIFLRNALYNSFNGKSVVEGRSVLKGKLDSQIGVKNLNLYDDGQLLGDPMMNAFDHEGNPKQKTCLIQNGIIKSFMFDQYYANVYGTKSTGNAVRAASQTYEGLPTVSLNTTTVEPGSKNLDELVSTIENGILIVDSVMGIHTSNYISGDFSFGCDSAFLISNGEIARPISAISVAGNFHEAFNQIIAIGNDMELNMGSYLPSIAYDGFSITG